MIAFKRIRDAINGKLFADWAAAVDAVAVEFDVATSDLARVREIDWSGSKRQVYFGSYEIEDLMDAGAVVWPVVVIAVGGATSPSDGKLFARFQGDAVARVDVHFSWLVGRALPKTEEVADLISAALVRSLLDPAWGCGLSDSYRWTAEASLSRSGVIQAAENWLQTITLEMTFHVEE